jgi:CRISPR type III-associated protein (TIGR04423 family)
MKGTYTSITKDALKEQSELLGQAFSGYYWYSDKTEPEKIDNQAIKEAWFTELPFIVEANFYCEKAGISIQVKHIDGQYRIGIINLKSTPDHLKTEQEYIAHDLPDIKAFKLVQGWDEEVDPLLEGMKTRVPTWIAFTGFIHS